MDAYGYRAIKYLGVASLWASTLRREDIYFIISLIITILSMILDYLKHREEEESHE